MTDLSDSTTRADLLQQIRHILAAIALTALTCGVAGCSVAMVAADAVGTAAETAVDVTATAATAGAKVIGKGVEVVTDKDEPQRESP